MVTNENLINPKRLKKKLNLISWNDKDPKYDIREWSPDHSKMGKGVTLTIDEVEVKVFLGGTDL